MQGDSFIKLLEEMVESVLLYGVSDASYGVSDASPGMGGQEKMC